MATVCHHIAAVVPFTLCPQSGEPFWQIARATAPGSVEFAVNTHAIGSYLQPGARVLDIGAGPGRYSPWPAERGHRVVLPSAAVGWGPVVMAVDERTGHTFVTSAGGVMRVPDFWGRVPSWVRGWLPFLPHPSFRTRLVPGSVSVIDTTR